MSPGFLGDKQLWYISKSRKYDKMTLHANLMEEWFSLNAVCAMSKALCFSIALQWVHCKSKWKYVFINFLRMTLKNTIIEPFFVNELNSQGIDGEG